MIHVVAIITAKPGMREAILKEFHANMPAVHAENGCMEYGPAIDVEGIGSFQAKFGPDTFVVIENGRARKRSGPTPPCRTCRPMRPKPGK
jgi:quinol monooxygenase YgiN